MLGPFSKIQTGWLDPIVISANGAYAVQPSAFSKQVYKITSGFPTKEYLLIENRYAVKWESNWPAKGIVIWHVDEKAPVQQQRGYPGSAANFPTEHYTVSVLQADGLYSIEKGDNLGDAGDIWTEGMTLGPGPDFPNTDSIQSGQVKTGVSITVKTASSFIIMIEVSGIA
jgi:immune inhibitor A